MLGTTAYLGTFHDVGPRHPFHGGGEMPLRIGNGADAPMRLHLATEWRFSDDYTLLCSRIGAFSILGNSIILIPSVSNMVDIDSDLISHMIPFFT